MLVQSLGIPSDGFLLDISSSLSCLRIHTCSNLTWPKLFIKWLLPRTLQKYQKYTRCSKTQFWECLRGKISTLPWLTCHYLNSQKKKKGYNLEFHKFSLSQSHYHGMILTMRRTRREENEQVPMEVISSYLIYLENPWVGEIHYLHSRSKR